MHFAPSVRISFLKAYNSPLHMYIYHIFIISSQWILGLFSCLSYCKYCCCEHWEACVFWISVIFFSRYIPRSGIAGSYSSSILFFEELPCCFPWWLHQFTFPATVYKGSLFSTSSPAFVVCRLFSASHSEVMGISQCCFDFISLIIVMLSIFQELVSCMSSMENVFSGRLTF